MCVCPDVANTVPPFSCVVAPVRTHPCSCLAASPALRVFSLLALLVGVWYHLTVLSVGLAHMVNEVEHFLHVDWTFGFFFLNWLFKSFAHLSIGSLPFRLRSLLLTKHIGFPHPVLLFLRQKLWTLLAFYSGIYTSP